LGSLAVSRSLGDIDFKFPHNKAEGDFVSAEPFLNVVKLGKEHEFLVLACDGLWYSAHSALNLTESLKGTR
jgi:serine/threonine protein phosphatase PrpC